MMIVFRLMFWICAVSISFCVQADDLSELVDKARQNDANAQYQLAIYYQQSSDASKKLQDAFYWFQQAADNHHTEAMEKIANAYLKGEGTEVNTLQGLYWLTKAATLGNTHAQITLGQVYQQLPQSPSPLDLAEIWFRGAAEFYPEAEAAYTTILETKFNQRRALQVSSIAQLDDVIDQQIDSVNNQAPAKPDRLSQDYTLVILIIVLLIILVSFYRYLKKKKQFSQATERVNVDAKLAESSATIKKQKRQLDTLYRELKRTQQHQTNNSEAQKYQLACAILGYHPNQVPDSKTIKIRYKQLSKIYHPDMKGSEEEMKRLNGALKTILTNVNN